MRSPTRALLDEGAETHRGEKEKEKKKGGAELERSRQRKRGGESEGDEKMRGEIRETEVRREDTSKGRKGERRGTERTRGLGKCLTDDGVRRKKGGGNQIEQR